MEFTSLIQTFGSGAVIVILLSILVTEIRSSRKLMSSLESTIEDQDEKLRQLAEQVAWLHDNHTTREEMYRQMEGWRQETGEIKSSLARMDERLYQLTGGRR